jgi:hypothetical protein
VTHLERHEVWLCAKDKDNKKGGVRFPPEHVGAMSSSRVDCLVSFACFSDCHVHIFSTLRKCFTKNGTANNPDILTEDWVAIGELSRKLVTSQRRDRHALLAFLYSPLGIALHVPSSVMLDDFDHIIRACLAVDKPADVTAADFVRSAIACANFFSNERSPEHLKLLKANPHMDPVVLHRLLGDAPLSPADAMLCMRSIPQLKNCRADIVVKSLVQRLAAAVNPPPGWQARMVANHRLTVEDKLCLISVTCTSVPPV